MHTPLQSLKSKPASSNNTAVNNHHKSVTLDKVPPVSTDSHKTPSLTVLPATPKTKNPTVPVNSVLLATPKVLLNRIKIEDLSIMEKSLSEFAKKSPELALKLGVSGDIDESASTANVDMFNMIKATDRMATKRRNPTEIEAEAKIQCKLNLKYMSIFYL